MVRVLFGYLRLTYHPACMMTAESGEITAIKSGGMKPDTLKKLAG
jgi:hypothetical protein